MTKDTYNGNRMGLISTAYAHEAYVLSPQQFHHGLTVFNRAPLAGLFDPAYVGTTVVITILVVTFYLLTFC